MQKGALIFFIFVFISACGTVKRGTIPWEDEAVTTTTSDTSQKPAASISEMETTSPEIQEMQEYLQLAYQDWKGIPYLLGGTGYNGIDCSAFMQVVFEDYFSRMIPRTTREQMNIGAEVSKGKIRTGDLVFFKTGRRTYHVGVMINRKEFLHASTTEGVKISDLTHPFWQETYLSTRRIF